ncbi:subtilisin-like protein [Ascobolus immersus RN42]|uniref:Subtilisin-like protein n=1 Tax=Ascobolus immersus RN42 TaxID=1160509 RepID=A0A3N4HW39_ASCIM|nr:subtilisin-like protein [Ascobolus immersus RN42]
MESASSRGAVLEYRSDSLLAVPSGTFVVLPCSGVDATASWNTTTNLAANATFALNNTRSDPLDTAQTGLAKLTWPLGYFEWDNSYWKAIHNATGIWELQKGRLLGEGVSVAIFDFGFYLDHDAYSCLDGSQCRLLSGWNFADNDDNLLPFSDQDFAASHGTEVSLAATGGNKFLVGPMPLGNMLPVKIGHNKAKKFGPDGERVTQLSETDFNSSDPKDLSKAIEFAQTAGCHIISMSYGPPTSWSSRACPVYLDEVADNGYLLFASPTNDGEKGVCTLTLQSSAQKVIAVGNYDSGYIPSFELVAKIRLEDARSAQELRFGIIYSFGNVPFGKKVLRLQAFRSEQSTDVTEPYGSDLCSLQDYDPDLPVRFPPRTILLVRVSLVRKRNRLTGEYCLDRVNDLLDRGASGVLLWTPEVDKQNVAREEPPIKHEGKPVGWLLDDIMVNLLLTALSARGSDSASVTFPLTPKIMALKNPTSDGPGLHSTSGSGPTWDLKFGIDIVTPGTEILLAEKGGYGPGSGTSVATPIAAGGAGQVLAANIRRDGKIKALSPDAISLFRSRMIHSARPVPARASQHHLVANPDHPSLIVYEPPWKTGTGVVNFTNMYFTTLELSPDSIELGDISAGLSRTLQLTFRNPTDKPESIRVRHHPGPGQYQITELDLSGPYIPTSLRIPTYFNEFDEEDDYDMNLAAKVVISESEIIVPENGEKNITLSFTLPDLAPAQRKRFPLYGGFIFAVNQDDDEFTWAYFGLAALSGDTPLLMREPQLRWMKVAEERGFQDVPKRDVVDINKSPESTSTDSTASNTSRLASLHVSLASGAEFMAIDYVLADWKPGKQGGWEYPQVLGKHGYCGSIAYMRHIDRSPADPRFPGYFNKVALDGSAFHVEENIVKKIKLESTTENLYKVRLMVLRVGGNYSKESDYEAWTSSQTFRIVE